MITFKNISDQDERFDKGGSLVGTITTTRKQLVTVFGAPDDTMSLDMKVTTEWTIDFSNGVWAKIYDWKRIWDFSDDADEDEIRPGMDEVYGWHVGSDNPDALKLVLNAITSGNGPFRVVS